MWYQWCIKFRRSFKISCCGTQNRDFRWILLNCLSCWRRAWRINWWGYLLDRDRAHRWSTWRWSIVRTASWGYTNSRSSDWLFCLGTLNYNSNLYVYSPTKSWRPVRLVSQVAYSCWDRHTCLVLILSLRYLRCFRATSYLLIIIVSFIFKWISIKALPILIIDSQPNCISSNSVIKTLKLGRLFAFLSQHLRISAAKA